MSAEEGALLLLRRAKMVDGSSYEQINSEEMTNASVLVDLLGGLPLALDQAGAYIEETACTVANYVRAYRSRQSFLLNRRGSPALDHPDSVGTTFSLSFEQVQQVNPLAAELLQAFAFFAPDAIPDELLLNGAKELALSQDIVNDPFLFDEAIATLRRFSLIRRNRDNHTLAIHRLVQSVMQGKMEEGTHRLWATLVILAVSAVFPSEVTVDCWPQCQRLLSHVQMCASFTDAYQISLPESATLFNQAGYYLREQAFYAEAEQFYLRALTLREQLLGKIHPDTAQVLYNLARLYYDLGQYHLCEKFHLQALEIREQALPPDQLALALSLNSLAFLYYIQARKPDESERLYQRALPLFDAAIGMDHPKTAHCLSNLALLYASQGKDAEAEQLLLRVQAIRETCLGPMHLDTARSLQNLAWFYIDQRKQERYEEAKQLLKRSLAIRETLLGPEHPQVAISLNHLALLCEAQGDYAGAKQLYQQALIIRRKMMGQDSPRVRLTEVYYASLLHKMGLDEEAAQLEEHIQAIHA
jgi:tetratricopeptide (TPR) repeat protein